MHAVSSYIEEHNVPCEWRPVSGCLQLWTDEVMAEAEKELALLKKVAPDVAERVTIIKDKEALRAHRVHPDCVGATLTKGAATLWPYKLVTFILEKLVKEGRINLQTTTPVTEITSSPDHKTHTLHTARGTITTPTVILATNGYTSALIPSFADLIVPVRGEMSALYPPKGSTILPNSYGMVGALGQPANNDDYLMQRPYSGVPNPSGYLMFGGGRGAGHLPTIGVSDDTVLDPDSAAYLRRALLQVMLLDGETEGVTELKAAAEWTGIMGYSRDNHPWVGKVPGKEGVWLAGGYTGHGMPNGTLCGKAVVEMVLREEAGEDIVEVQRKMVEEGGMPGSYVITEERVQRARKGLTVEQQEETGVHMNGVV